MSNQPDATWTPLDAAAARLGISPDAARKRLERGTLRGEKRGGRWHVFLDNLDAMSGQNGRHLSGQQDATQDAVWTLSDATADMAWELIDQLKSENEYLRAQLAERSRELAAERERSDVLQQLALSRIPAVGAGEPVSVHQAAAGAFDEPDMADGSVPGERRVTAAHRRTHPGMGGPDRAVDHRAGDVAGGGAARCGAGVGAGRLIGAP
jgi:hypothetical protein